MFWTLAFKSVGQQHHQTGHPQPLGFGRGNELIDDDLGTVGEIAELRFPQRQRLGLGGRIAVFKAQNPQLGQRRVDDLQSCLIG